MVLLDTGDAWVGGKANGSTTLGDRTEGAAIVAAMNALGYRAMALGPYELSLGPEALSARMEEAAFPVVSANAYGGGGRRVAPPHAVIDVAGRRIAVIGLTRPPETMVEGFEVRDPRSELESVLPRAASEADTVFVLTNLDLEAARESVEGLRGIGLVAAGRPYPLPDHAIRVEDSGALLVTAEWPTPGHTGRRVGRLEATLGLDGIFSGETWSTLSLDKAWDDDPDMAALLESFERDAPWP